MMTQCFPVVRLAMAMPASRRQQGLTLLEALVAILVLALGVLALLGVQLSTLAETQNTARRAQAIRIMEDLSERIKSNPGGFDRLDDYVLSAWTNTANLPAASVDCAAASCTAQQMATWDVSQWARTALNLLPPRSELITFLSAAEDAGNRRQLGIMIGWPLREYQPGETDPASSIERFNVEASNQECPDDLLCHVIYVQP